MECSRGDVWLIHLDPTKGREQKGTRPGLIVSVDEMNHGPADLVVVLPITSKEKGIPSSRMFRIAHWARGSVKERVAGLASSFPLLARYRPLQSLPDPIPRLFIRNVLLHAVDEGIDQLPHLRFSLGPDRFLRLARERKTLS